MQKKENKTIKDTNRGNTKKQSNKPERFNIYSKRELLWMEPWQEFKDKSLVKVLKVLAFFHVSADILSMSAFVFGILFLFNVKHDSMYNAAYFLLAHIIFDGLDGSMARYTKTEGVRGSFTDVVSDHFMIFCTTFGMMASGMVNALIAFAYFSVYTFQNVFAFVRNRMDIKSEYVLRPRLVIYAFFFLQVLLFKNYINEAMVITSLLMLPGVVAGFVKIRRGL